MKIEWKSCLRIGVSAFLLFLCITYWEIAARFIGMVAGAAFPLLVGCIIAYLVNILMSFYEKKIWSKPKNKWLQRVQRPVCLALAYVTLLALLGLVVLLIVPQLISCGKVVFTKLPGVLMDFAAWINQTGILPDATEATIENVNWQEVIGQVGHVVTSGLGSVVEVIVKVVSSVFSGIVSLFLGLIFSMYLLAGKEKIGNQIHRVACRYVRKKWRKKGKYVIGVLDDCFHRYIVGQCTEAVILGALCTIGMWILRLPYASMIGAFIAFTALIPVAGAYIGAGVGAFMIFTESPIQAIIFILFIIVLQQLEGNIIYPRVVGSSIGLPGIWVLAAVTVGGGVMGITGMLLGVPLAATAYRFIKEDVNREP